jgi:hypothetical protein
MRQITLTLLVLACAPAALIPATAGAATQPPKMQLLSKSFNGGFPNGASHNGAFSQDQQLATLAAFDSDASNIIRHDPNGFTDVFVVHRGGKFDLDGQLWKRGKVRLVSKARNGGPANGPSYRPDIDGEQGRKPRCIAFISEASNLVGGDTNGVADAFVKNLRSGRIKRVSVNSAGEQANGPTTEVKVDGHCDRVAFVSTASNLALTATNRFSWRSAVTGVPAAGTKQVYVHVIDGFSDNAALEGLTFLASATPGGGAGNGDSDEVAFARSGGGCGRVGRCGDFSGEAVFFTSHATNLSSTDTDPGADVYRRSFERRFVRLHFPSPRRVDGDRVRSTLVGVGPLQMVTKLMSVAEGGEPANGPSDQAVATDSGHFVAFRTFATNLIPRDTNGQPDVVRLNTSDRSFAVVSRTESGTLANGPSAHPAIGRTGLDIVFESAATNLDGNDKNCTGDIYHIDFPANNQILSSLDSSNRVPNAPFGSGDDCPAAIAAPAIKPVASYYLNYILLESSYVLLDRRIASKAFPNVNASEAAFSSTTNPNLHQVYLRFLSPR